MSRVAAICLFFIQSFSFGQQIVLDKNSHDFGDLYGHSERFIDFYFKNTSDKNAYILRVEKNNETAYELSSSTIAPGESQALRIQVNINKKGAFRVQTKVFISSQNDPVILEIRGHIKEIATDFNSLTKCPDFRNRPSDGNPLDFMLTVVTIDKETKQLLAKSEIEVIQNGLTIAEWLTNKDGKVQQKIPLGFTYFVAYHDGYFPKELGAYVNFRRNYILIELDREEIIEEQTIVISDNRPTTPDLDLTDSTAIVVKEEGKKRQPKYEQIEIDWPINKDNSIDETPKRSQRKKNDQTEETVQKNPNVDTSEHKTEGPKLADIPKEEFSSSYFTSNNLVFVLDVSFSMSKEERLELMKLSLIELMNYVRPEDKITIVTYGNNARVIVPTASGANKDEVIDRVRQLTAGGMTAGGQGIRTAYSMLHKATIPDGNNQIIVITDGAFNKDSQDIESTIRRLAKNGHILSVVGIKSEAGEEEKMNRIAELGNGRFIGINSVADAKTMLIDEIRVASYRHKF